MQRMIVLYTGVALLIAASTALAQVRVGVGPRGGVGVNVGGVGVRVGAGGVGVRVGGGYRSHFHRGFGYGHHHHHHHGFAGYGYPYYTQAYSYYPVAASSLYQPQINPYGIYYNPSSNYVDYYLPPYYAPAELLYGPQAMKQFMGVDRNFALGPLASTASRPVVVEEAAPLELGEVVRESNPETRRKARRIMAVGDTLFGKQRYHEALQQYKSAAKLAPDVAEFYFRQGHALIPSGRYELAFEAFERGLEIDPSWAIADFELDSIYGDTRLAKSAHLDSLASEALDVPDSADLLYLLGVFLHYDGQADRAEKFFRRAAELVEPDDAHVRPFLAAEAEAGGVGT